MADDLLTYITWEEHGGLLSFLLGSGEVERQQGLVSGLVLVLKNAKDDSVDAFPVVLKEPPNCP